MREFNRLINRRQLSDLKTFKIEPVEEIQLVEAMNVLIQQAEQTESGQSLELFDQGSILDDVELDRAKSLLIEEGSARQGLRVADLFRLEFVVAKQGQQQESFEDIDSAASNGTVLMAKLVTGLAMLHLMQDKRHQMKAVCYLDEALALDTKNQANLIEIADQFGFALIFASPAPLTTARYCVPIHQANGKNHISRNSWQIFERKEREKLSQLQPEALL
ncbi:chromosome segregation ATPases [Vibrio variabilis]|uniref:Chromosome segregation ATPases n=1 Tax=Vibrio variabilis TaxID=990271 RepID=A0ABQ0JKL0_9VIBR|nr:chromosome segregation ATPases [Vibrio variabilis]